MKTYINLVSSILSIIFGVVLMWLFHPFLEIHQGLIKYLLIFAVGLLIGGCFVLCSKLLQSKVKQESDI